MEKSKITFIYTLFILLGFSLAFIPGVAFPLLLGFIFITLFVIKYDFICYILIGYPFLDYIFRNYITSFSSIWDELLFVGMIFIWGCKFIIHRKDESFKQTPLDLPIFIFIWAMLIVFIINSPDYSISFDGLRATIQYILWYFVVIQLLKNEKSSKNLCIIFVLVVGLMALHGIYQYVIGVENPAGWTDSKEAGVRTRVFSILTSPNILGSLFTLALPICLSLISISRKIGQKLIYVFLTLVMILALLFTFSRGAWIGFMAAIFIYFLLKDKRLIIPVFILAILILMFVPSVAGRITYLLSPEYIQSSLRGGRLVRWLTGLQILSSYPIFGIGHGHFGGAVAINNDLSFLVGTELTKTFYMDNYYLKTAVETGIFGLLAFIMLMYQVFINSIRTIKITPQAYNRHLQTGILAGLVGIMVHNLVENVFEVPMMTTCFWVLVATLMNFWCINKKDAIH